MHCSTAKVQTGGNFMSRRPLQVVGAVLCASLALLIGGLGLQQPSRFYILRVFGRSKGVRSSELFRGAGG
jgi:hypothetical protein